jgi:hypothetical protein
MSDTISTVSTPAAQALSQFPMFGPPPLLKGEDVAAYDELLARVSGNLKPSDIFEEIWMREIVDLSWEAFRWRRLLAAFIAILIPKALERILQRLTKNQPASMSRETSLLGKLREAQDSLDAGQKLATEWEAGDKTAIERVQGMLVSAGKTMESVVAQATASELDKIERFNRLIASAEARRNAALHEIERHRAPFAQRLRAEIHKLDGAEFETVESNTIAPIHAANENAA